MGPEGGDGGAVCGNQQLTVGGKALVPAGRWQDGQLRPSVHKKVVSRGIIIYSEKGQFGAGHQ